MRHMRLYINVDHVATVRQARRTDEPDPVEAARARAQDGDVVLLSPACTSFDGYDNFEQRGIEFRRLVKELNTK